MRNLSAALLALLVCFPVLGAVPVGDEIPVNTFTTSDQIIARTGRDASGNFVVVWTGYNQDDPLSGYAGVFGQRFDSSGNPTGGEFQVNTVTANNQGSAAVSMRDNGEFVVVWQQTDNSSYGVFGRRYSSDGSPNGTPFQINTFTTGLQGAPQVALNDSGQFVVAWDSYGADGDSFGVRAQIYDSNGATVGAEMPVNEFTTERQQFPSVSIDGTGNFVVAWESFGQDGAGYGIFGQRFDSSGAKVGAEFPVNSITLGNQGVPSVSRNAAGAFVIVWDSQYGDNSGYGVAGRRYASDGSDLSGEFQLNDFTTGNQFFPDVSIDSNGAFVVAWDSYGLDGSETGVFAREFTSKGTPVSNAFQGVIGEFQVNTFTTGYQQCPSVSLGDGGEFVVAWTSYGQDDPASGAGGVYAQRFEGDQQGQDDIVFDFGNPTGVYSYDNNQSYRLLTGLDPVRMATVDFAGDGTDDVIFDFGVDGVYTWDNCEFAFLNGLDTQSIESGDLDGNGLGDVVFDYGSGVGVYTFSNDSTYAFLTGLVAEQVLVGNLGTDSDSDIIFDFGVGIGVYTYNTTTGFAFLTGLDPVRMAIGDVDNTGGDDVIFDFGPGIGIYAYDNNSTYRFLTGIDTELITLCDLDGNGLDEIIYEFAGGVGIWAFDNNTSYRFLTGLDAEIIACGDLDGSGQGDLVYEFSGGLGVYTFMNNTTYNLLTGLPVETLVVGDFDGVGGTCP